MLEKPTILIAGATGSIGNALALVLAQRGARVVLLGRRAEKLNAKADRILGADTDAADDVATLVVDFSDLESVRSAADEALSRFPTIDGLVLSVPSVTFDPTFALDKSDPELKGRWPSGFAGLVWRLMATSRAKPAAVAGEPLAELMLDKNRSSIDGALFVLDKRSDEPDSVMSDEAEG